MVVRDVHDAIAQVRELHQRVIESGRFRAYSGRARAISGMLALLAAACMSREAFPRTPLAHLSGWLVVASAGILLNYGALACYLFGDPKVRHDIRRALPTVHPLPGILVGGVLTVAMARSGHHEHLFGVWMCVFGLVNLSSRQFLPRAIWPVGGFYLVCGTACLLTRSVSFLDPWPMGIVFFLGEWLGGLVFFVNRNPGVPVSRFFWLGRKAQ